MPTTNGGTFFVVTGTPFAGVTFNAGTSTFNVPGSYTNLFPSNTIITVTGTGTTNDGYYKVSSSTYTGGNTVVTVTSYSTGTSYPGTVPFVSSGTGRVINMGQGPATSLWTNVFTGTLNGDSFITAAVAGTTAIGLGGANSYGTTNGGTTWNLLTFPISVQYRVGAGSAIYVFDGTNNGVYYTTNGGTTWTNLVLTGAYIQDGGSGSNPQYGWTIQPSVASNGDLYISQNNQNDRNVNLWKVANGTYTATLVIAQSVGPNFNGSGNGGTSQAWPNTIAVNGSTLLCVGYNATQGYGQSIFKSTDSGNTWSDVYDLNATYPNNVRVDNLFYTGVNYVLVGTGPISGEYVSLTSPDTINWTQTYFGTGGPPYAFGGEDQEPTALIGNTILTYNPSTVQFGYSADNGATWHNSTPTISSVNSLYANTSRAYAGGPGVDSSPDGITWTNELSSTSIAGATVVGNSSFTLAFGSVTVGSNTYSAIFKRTTP